MKKLFIALLVISLLVFGSCSYTNEAYTAEIFTIEVPSDPGNWEFDAETKTITLIGSGVWSGSNLAPGKEVNTLIVMVVQEDKSKYSFLIKKLKR